MNENKRSGNLVLVVMASMFVLALVFMAAFFFSREPSEITGSLTPSPTEKTVDYLTTAPTEKAEHTSDMTSAPEQDTTAPVVITKRVVVAYGTEVAVEDFIFSIEDESECTITYVSGRDGGPDVTNYGLQNVQIAVTDTAGNTTTVTAVLNVLNLVSCLEWHIGTEFPKPEMFLIQEGSEISYITDVSLINVMQAGEYGIDLLVDGDMTTSIISIDDRKDPVVVTKDAETWLNEKLTVRDFISEITDDTQVSVLFYSEPKWNVEGVQTVKIIVSDAAANIVTVEAKLTVKSKPDAAESEGTE